ncbi:MAG: flagellar filament capping protein FliD, partial [Chromatiales bacterium]|nr:flagellar filament capping protein FliD [Chromatiales bacterium]
EVEILTVADNVASGNIGLTANTAAVTAGVDVTGTIGALNATGSGKYLTADGSASGLKLYVDGGATGSRGQVHFSRGITHDLDELLGKILDSEGFLTSKTDSLNRQIKDVGEEREKLAGRLQRMEARYLAQFSAMDAMVSQLQSTSTFLAGQLASLPGMAYQPKER